MKKSIKLSAVLVSVCALLLTSCINNEITNISSDKTSLNLVVGHADSLAVTLTFTGDLAKQQITYNSGNTAVATVKESAIAGTSTATTTKKTVIVSGVSPGTATITVLAGGKTITCTITVDDIFPTLSQGELDYWGDVYTSTTSNNFTLYFASSGIDLTTLKGIGEILVVELNTPLTVTDSIPTGTYDMITDLTTANLLPNTLVPAYVDDSNNQWGCWYYGSVTSPITLGNIVISKVGANYTIVYELYDYLGAKISGTYTGALTYVDTTAAAAGAPKSVLKSKGNFVQPTLIPRKMTFRKRN